MKKLIVANWKMNPSSARQAISLARGTEKGIVKSTKAEVAVAPPFPFLIPVKKVLKKVGLGAQDDFWENIGAYTGEVSPVMLKTSGVKYVIIGHSERRRLGETDGMINKKIKAALKLKLKPILCVGEGAAVRKKGFAAAKNFVKSQLVKDLKGMPATRLIVAYEPIWAISTNKGAKPEKPEDSLEMIRFIKSFLGSKFRMQSPCVLYGGSVNSKNAESFLQYKQINGALVGGASLKPEEFKKIINSSIKQIKWNTCS